VKNDSCHGPRRLPRSSGSPRTEDARNRLRHPDPSTSFANASLPARARPPSPTPAATEMASLDQTLLDDFCNQDGIRGTPPRLHDLTRTAMARDSLRSRPLGPTHREPCVPMAETTGGTRRGATHGPSHPRASVHAAVQRPTLECSSTPLVAAHRAACLDCRQRQGTAKAPLGRRTTRTVPPPQKAGVLSAIRRPARGATPHGSPSPINDGQGTHIFSLGA
jgi:hypothetical protein